jgi:hypothetical protein
MQASPESVTSYRYSLLHKNCNRVYISRTCLLTAKFHLGISETAGCRHSENVIFRGDNPATPPPKYGRTRYRWNVLKSFSSTVYLGYGNYAGWHVSDRYLDKIYRADNSGWSQARKFYERTLITLMFICWQIPSRYLKNWGMYMTAKKG